ncbi:hypothetical protein SARC_05962 [Sphaeroforma arctica JP610]|uniref:Histidine kinase/HSP90-like ATPase domain-containing protein n=1 Tax=Sphaeroforma arctica JP610 TaxID=667725 RepID=A0A0L0FYT8_9EUKA|nr:hypothetical protein SARC_05962 [Sphaeroforma arctica JP610]KNC81721.1 hypothetical protein SARC_05962 [Sphaeroforma arctica JP610]|eukprot:XP_014155623.1 hypothetical protein SARC_05962 [Sphaeroforma arctica JP610]
MPPKKKSDGLQVKSPAEFFANNKGIAGFDNPGKSLYTTVREFVENSLDAAEACDTLPEIKVVIEEIVNADFIGNKINKGNKKTDYYKVTVTDNGSGMRHEDIPNMFGRVLAGTKYQVKQNRGRFGLGAKMALIWAKMSTGQPLSVRSSRGPNSKVTECTLDIDIYKNAPRIIRHVEVPNTEGWRGSEITVVIEGTWTTYRAKILSYMRQLAVITPYAEFSLIHVSLKEDKSFEVRYARRTEHMPAPAYEVKHHPSSVDLIVLKKILGDAAHANKKLKRTLTHEFAGISSVKANEIIERMGRDKMDAIAELEEKDIKSLRGIFHDTNFPTPDGDCLSPAGEYNLRLGIMKELKPEMVATCQVPAGIFEGHPFIVEAGVSLGGKKVRQGINVYRFANRIPLLFENGADVVTRTAMTRINWKSYKMNPTTDKIGVFVSIVSTKIPFKGTGKEYIGDDAEALAISVKKAIMLSCQQLSKKLAKAHSQKAKQERKKMLTKYIPNVCDAIMTTLRKIDTSEDALSAKRLRLDSRTCVNLTDDQRKAMTSHQVLNGVKSKNVTVEELKRKLEIHVEKANFNEAMDLQMSRATQDKTLDRVRLHIADWHPKLPACSNMKLQHPQLKISIMSGSIIEQ